MLLVVSSLLCFLSVWILVNETASSLRCLVKGSIQSSSECPMRHTVSNVLPLIGQTQAETINSRSNRVLVQLCAVMGLISKEILNVLCC